MWFAFKFLPLQYLRQRRHGSRQVHHVVICFQILTFAVSATAVPDTARTTCSCDLLSNSYLCSICDSHAAEALWRHPVVICFQILTFAVSATAGFVPFSLIPLLWFAFKFLPLQYLRQHAQLAKLGEVGCDLLSNSYLCSICDSARLNSVMLPSVVICFQILTFAVSATASLDACTLIPLLWFAFKFLPLQYLRQLNAVSVDTVFRCDLLSNSYLCSICDSKACGHGSPRAVVICFQILTFAVSATACRRQAHIIIQLWFAFKFLPLQYLRQL